MPRSAVHLAPNVSILGAHVDAIRIQVHLAIALAPCIEMRSEKAVDDMKHADMLNGLNKKSSVGVLAGLTNISTAGRRYIIPVHFHNVYGSDRPLNPLNVRKKKHVFCTLPLYRIWDPALHLNVVSAFRVSQQSKSVDV